MLELPRQTLINIKKRLLRQQKEVKTRIKDLEKDDPVLAPGAEEASEPGTESWRADVHGRMVALKDDLLKFSQNIARSLISLKKGTYGKCECCGKQIEEARLKAMPTATLCMVCSKQKCTHKKSGR